MTKHKRTQTIVLAWAVDVFGPVAKNIPERAARLVEEAVEVAQAAGLDPNIAHRIIDRVYERPTGDIFQELGGCQITLEAMAECVNIDNEKAADIEWERVLSKDHDWWRQKHQAKIEAGTANVDTP